MYSMKVSPTDERGFYDVEFTIEDTVWNYKRLTRSEVKQHLQVMDAMIDNMP